MYALEPKAALAAGMGEKVHWFPEDISATRLAAVLVGMANTAGGVVMVGVAPRSRQIQGVRDREMVLDKVFQAALLSDPPLVLPMPTVHHFPEGNLVQVVVPPGLPHVYSLDGRYLGREGSQTNPLPARRLRKILVERGIVQFESQIPPQATLEDLDLEKAAAYVEALDLPGDAPVEQVLLQRGCLRPVEERARMGSRGSEGRTGDEVALRPTYAALLLFGRQPQRWLPSATILAARFSGGAFSDRYVKKEITGTLPDQLEQAEAFVRESVHSVVRLVGLKHQEMPEYPLEAVRELLVNAVAHRDYNQGGDSIHLNIFADRIEVHSPGGLPGPVNLDNLLQARFSRNAVIVQVLSDLGFVERLGYGLDRVVNVMRQNGLRTPQFEEIAGSFRVTLYGQPEEVEARKKVPAPDVLAYREAGLNPRQEMALGYLSQNRRITNREYQELCPDVHPETLRRDLVDLVTRDILIKVGDKRATYYILK